MTYTYNIPFAGLEPVAGEIDFDKLPESQQTRVIRIGLDNIIRDVRAGKASDPAVARDTTVKRIAALNSDFTGGGAKGPRLTPEESTRRDVIDERLATWAETNNHKLPKKQTELQPLRDKWMATEERARSVETEVARRLAAKKKAAPVDVSDLLAAL